jgi:hypothetical protein
MSAVCVSQVNIDHRALSLKITKSKFHLGTLRCGNIEDTTGLISFVQPSKKIQLTVLAADDAKCLRCCRRRIAELKTNLI